MAIGQVVERLAEDLQREFPGKAGFSPKTSGICGVFISPGPRNFKNSNSLLENPPRKFSRSLWEN